MSSKFHKIDYEVNDVHLIVTGIASLLSFLSTSFTLFLYFRYSYLRSFAFKLVTLLNLTGFL